MLLVLLTLARLVAVVGLANCTSGDEEREPVAVWGDRSSDWATSADCVRRGGAGLVFDLWSRSCIEAVDAMMYELDRLPRLRLVAMRGVTPYRTFQCTVIDIYLTLPKRYSSIAWT